MNKLKLLALLLSTFSITQAQAQTTTTAPLNISATVSATCTLSASSIAFGTISLSGPSSLLMNGSTVTLNCTKGTAYSIKADGGLNYANNTRAMKNSGNTDLLIYSLSYNSSGTNGTVPVNTTFLSGSGTGTQSTFNMLANISPMQNVSAGNYLDTVTLSITY